MNNGISDYNLSTPPPGSSKGFESSTGVSNKGEKGSIKAGSLLELQTSVTKEGTVYKSKDGKVIQSKAPTIKEPKVDLKKYTPSENASTFLKGTGKEASANVLNPSPKTPQGQSLQGQNFWNFLTEMMVALNNSSQKSFQTQVQMGIVTMNQIVGTYMQQAKLQLQGAQYQRISGIIDGATSIASGAVMLKTAAAAASEIQASNESFDKQINDAQASEKANLQTSTEEGEPTTGTEDGLQTVTNSTNNQNNGGGGNSDDSNGSNDADSSKQAIAGKTDKLENGSSQETATSKSNADQPEGQEVPASGAKILNQQTQETLGQYGNDGIEEVKSPAVKALEEQKAAEAKNIGEKYNLLGQAYGQITSGIGKVASSQFSYEASLKQVAGTKEQAKTAALQQLQNVENMSRQSVLDTMSKLTDAVSQIYQTLTSFWSIAAQGMRRG